MVCWSLGHNCEPCKKLAEMIVMPFEILTPVGPRNHILDWCPDPAMHVGHFEGDDVRMSRTPQSTVRNGRDVGICL